jgi:hypothetical protein
VLIGAGAAARLISLALSWGKPLDPDASEYLLLGRRYSFLHPWSASYREPFWRGIVKAATAPFGYSPDALRSFTTLISIATLPVAWILLRRIAAQRGLGSRVPVIALAVIALSVQLMREAPRGLREDLCLLLFLFVAAPLLARDRSRRAAVTMALAIGALSVIRWELATLALGACLLFALARRGPALAPALALVLVVALSGPWLLANRARHGDLFYQAKVHSTFYWKLDQSQTVRQHFLSPPGVDPPIHLSWSQYYLDYLGPATTLKRTAEGYPRLAAKLVASQGVPRSAAISTLGTNQQGGRWLVTLAALAMLASAAALFAGARIRRRRDGASTFLAALALLAITAAPYAPIAALIELRVLLFAVPILALCTGIAVDACLPERVRVRETAVASG